MIAAAYGSAEYRPIVMVLSTPLSERIVGNQKITAYIPPIRKK